jgi:D-alanyl-lipoteichoic acid acyltransferase DltB (MBOAT superfamily)
MLFNSIEFVIFFPLVFVIYWFVVNGKLKNQNLLLLISSYIFYGWWDWRFLSLIVFSSIVDFIVGRRLNKTENHLWRKLLLLTSIIVNLGFLGFFKYYNFFAESFSDAFTLFGSHLDVSRLNIILPVGISFYTFQTLSYSIDVYKRKVEPTKDVIAFFAFVSFFPQLVAGPIERASNLLPQFYKKRIFSYHESVDGMRQVLWGLFKKIVIADNAAIYANDIFNNYELKSGSDLLLGAVYFAFQIYGDFSGYSDIAIGTSRVFGFNLKQNFAFPYFSRDIAEFWRRWHISLSSWFRDYLYFPLGGSKGGISMKIRNTLIIFIVSGFWHGANWTFIVWGFLNALYFIPLLLLQKNRVNTNTVAEGVLFPSVREFFQIGTTFFLTLIAWVFFRSTSVESAGLYLYKMFSKSLFEFPSVDIKPLGLICLLLIVEWFQREKQHGLDMSGINITVIRWLIYLLVFGLILFFGASSQPFIYFQF